MTNLKEPVFFDHDGSVDDLIALILLLGYDGFRVNGMSVTDGAGDIRASVDVTLRILEGMGNTQAKVAKSSVVAVNQFPENWRKSPHRILTLDCLQKVKPDFSRVSLLDGPDFLAETVLAEPEKTTMLLTGPATNFMAAVKKYPALIHKISRVIWMAGAFMAEGNVVAPDHDGSAEWNVYWDPASARELINLDIDLTMVAADVCHMVPADKYFMHQLGACTTSEQCQMVYRILEEPFQSHQVFNLFDVVAAVYLGNPQVAKTDYATIEIEQRGTSTGNTYRTEQGAKVRYLCEIDDEGFYEFIFSRLRKAPPKL